MGEECPRHLAFLNIRNQNRFAVFDSFDFFAGNACTYFCSIQLADIHITTGAPAKDKSFLSKTSHSVKKLIAKYIFWRLVQLASTAFVDFALVNLAVVLPFGYYQQRFLQPFGIQILRHHKSIARVGFGNVLLFPPVLCDIAIGATDLDVREHGLQPVHQCFAHDARQLLPPIEA